MTKRRTLLWLASSIASMIGVAGYLWVMWPEVTANWFIDDFRSGTDEAVGSVQAAMDQQASLMEFETIRYRYTIVKRKRTPLDVLAGRKTFELSYHRNAGEIRLRQSRFACEAALGQVTVKGITERGGTALR